MGVSRKFWMRHYYCSVIFPALLAVLFSSVHAHESNGYEAERKPLLVDSSWLQARLHTPGVVIVDARQPGEYVRGHIAGAISLPSVETFHPRLGERVATQSRIQYLLGRRGIRRDDHVILYGYDRYRDAARVLWVLALYGHSNVALLNGGYTAWKNAGLPVDTRIPLRKPVNYRAIVRQGLMSTRFHVLLALENPAIAIVDTRDAIEYQGFDSVSDRPGHIPTAFNIPSERNLEVRQGIPYIKSRPALQELYRDLADYSVVVLYCNNGCESSTSYLALRLLGKQVSIYDGGWKEWSSDPRLPVEDVLQ
ncbi:MAG: rhodanese-like domain-containing protein [Gammaproteobacteria bacterium]